MIKIVRVPLRVSFVGGGTDLPSFYSQDAGSVVSTTINKYIYITLKKMSGLFNHQYRVVTSNVETTNDLSSIQNPIVRATLQAYTKPGIGYDIDVMSDVPAGTGMGSSSAFCVGMCKALQPVLEKYSLASQASYIELDKLKEPIGTQDHYAAAFGGLNYIQFEKNKTTVKPVLLRPEYKERLQSHLHLFYLGKTRSASKILSKPADKDYLKELNQLAMSFHYALSNEYKNIGQLIKQGWDLKRKAMPHSTTSGVDHLIELIVKAGADGAKLLGAGQTGFILVYCSPDKLIDVIRAIPDKTIQYVPFKFEQEGCKLVYSE